MPVYVIDTLKPKNGLDFPVVEAVDVAVEGYDSLADAVTHFATDAMIEAINVTLSGKANTSDLNSAITNLQNQINQIEISSTAESVVAPEVAAARVGADGSGYSTLKERLDKEKDQSEKADYNLSGEISELSDNLIIKNLIQIPHTSQQNRIIHSNGEVVSADSNNYYVTDEIDISAYKRLYISGSTARGYLIYAFYNLSHEFISGFEVPNSASNVHVAIRDKGVTIPPDAKYVRICTYIYELNEIKCCYANINVIDRNKIEVADNSVSSISSEINGEFWHKNTDISYERGTLDDDGVEIAANNRYRSDFIYSNCQRIKIIVPEGLRVKIFEYTINKVFVEYTAGWITGEIEYYPNAYFKVVVSNVDNNNNILVYDAEKVAVHTSSLMNLNNTNIPVVYPVFEIGTYEENSLTKVGTANRRRTDLIEVDAGNYSFSLKDSYLVWIVEFDENYNFVKSSNKSIGGNFNYRFTGKYAYFILKNDEIASLVNIDYRKVLKIQRCEDYYTTKLKIEHGGLTQGKTTYSKADHEGQRRTAYTIALNGAKKIVFEDLYKYNYTYAISYFFNENYEYIDYVQVAKTSFAESSIEVMPNAKYVRIALVLTTSDVDYAIDYLTVSFVNGFKMPEEISNFKMRDDTEWITLDVTDSMYTCARMILPPNYEPTGKKVPLILFMDGSGNFTNWNADFSSGKKPYLLYLRDEGFAVLSVFGWGSNFIAQYASCGNAHPYPSPTPLACVKAGIEWACDRYNIDYDNIHIMSKSQGGQNALYYASRHDFPIKSIGMFAPVVDYLSMPGEPMYADTRKAIYDDMGFTGDKDYFGGSDYLSYSEEGAAFLHGNIEQLCQLNEAWTNLIGGTMESRFEDSITYARKFWTERYWTDETKTDIYTHTDRAKIADVPVKVWGASDDNNTPYLAMVEIVKQLQNGGSEAHMVTLPRGTGGHSCADVGSIREDITTALGILHTDVPIGWIQNVEWIRAKMPK